MKSAACRGVDPELFFPEPGEDHSEAKAICATCPVRVTCLEVNLNAAYGIYGGMNNLERKQYRRGRANHRCTCTECGAVFMAKRPRYTCSDECAKARHVKQKKASDETQRPIRLLREKGER